MKRLEGSALIIGYGNPGRLDDGLGPALAEAMDRANLPNVTVEGCYQLAIEHAELAARHNIVVFADACFETDRNEPFSFKPLEPKMSTSFSTHSIEPAVILGLAHNLFGNKTAGYVLAILGYAFDDFGEGLSAAARKNLDAATRFLQSLLLPGARREV
jgi:hydrogenase maturation protease